MHGVWSRGSKTKRKTNEDLKRDCQKDCRARKLNTEDAMDRSKWRKLIKDVRWSGWVWVGECFFLYRPTRVVPDQGPLNGCLCVCYPRDAMLTWVLAVALCLSMSVSECHKSEFCQNGWMNRVGFWPGSFLLLCVGRKCGYLLVVACPWLQWLSSVSPLCHCQKDNVFCSDFSVTSINKYNKDEFCENIVKDMQLKPKSTVVRLQNIPPGLMLSSDEWRNTVSL